MSLTFTVDPTTFEINIFDTTNPSNIILFQPNWPDGTEWDSSAQASLWAQLYILGISVNNANLSPFSPTLSGSLYNYSYDVNPTTFAVDIFINSAAPPTLTQLTWPDTTSWDYAYTASLWSRLYILSIVDASAPYAPTGPNLLGDIKPTPTPTPTPTVTPTPTITPTSTCTPTPTFSPTPTISVTATVTRTPTISISPTSSNTPSVTPTASLTPTPTLSLSPTITPSITPSFSASASLTPTPTRTVSITPTITTSNSATPTITPTFTPTKTTSVTPTRTATTTPTITPTTSIQNTPTQTRTPTITPTITRTPTISITNSRTPTITTTPSITKTTHYIPPCGSINSEIKTLSNFHNVNSISSKLTLSLLEDNLKSFLDWSFLNIGGFINVSIPTISIGSGNTGFHTLKPAIDNSVSGSKLWQAPRKDWVYEIGVSYESSCPIIFSGVYVNNTFLSAPSGSGAYSYSVNYPLGQIQFNNNISHSSNITANYSYRFVQVYKSVDSLWWKEIQKETYNTANFNNNGDYNIFAAHRIQLPAIIIEIAPRTQLIPYELGNTKNLWLQDVYLHIFAQNATQRNNLIDILMAQKDKTLFLYDSDKVAKTQSYNLHYDGSINTNGKSYPDLISTFKKNWCTILNSSLGELNSLSSTLYNGLVRWSIEIYP